MGVTPWVRHTPERAMNRKLRQAGFAARGLDDAAICQVAADDTDGYISEATVELLASAHREKNWKRLTVLLCEVGRWEATEGGWLIHDYAEYNMTREYWSSEKAKRSRAGRVGGQASAQARAAPIVNESLNGSSSTRSTDVGTDRQAASLRYEAKESKQASILTSPVDNSAAAVDNFEKALVILAERQADRTGPRDRAAYLATTIKALRSEFPVSIPDAERLSASELADMLKPPRKTASDPPEAARRDYDQVKVPCDFCDSTGMADYGNGYERCRACRA